jgi:adenosylcobyric acid synthase
MPWLEELFPPEDSLDLLERRGRRRDAEIEIAVVRLPSISNFSDLDPLEAEPTVRLRWVRPGEPLGRPDAVILPGSKQTLADLERLHRSGLAEEIRRYAGGDGHVLALCGGLQMIGRAVHDPAGLEGGGSAQAGDGRGLGLLPIRTVIASVKTLRRSGGRALWPDPAALPLPIEGFELHHGLSEAESPGAEPGLRPLVEGQDLGWVMEPEGGGSVAGTYLHGIFENGGWRRRWLNLLRRRRGLAALPEDVPHHRRQREALLDRLADAFEAHVNLDPLLGTGAAATDCADVLSADRCDGTAAQHPDRVARRPPR